MAAFTDLDLGSAPNDGTGTTLRAGGAIINANNALSANIQENNTFDAFMSFGIPESVTIASGIATITKSYVIINGEGGGADSLDTLTGSVPNGSIVILKQLTTSGTITVTQSGNIRITGTTVTLTSQSERLVLQKDGEAGLWVQIAYSTD